MSGINKIIVSNNQKNGGSQSALNSALVSATGNVLEKTGIKNKGGDKGKYKESNNLK